MIAIIDYGAGNLRSVTNSFQHLGADIRIVATPAKLAGAEKIVLPGVGALGAGMDALQAAGFVHPLVEAANDGTPLLGICLGLQYLFEWSDEMGHHDGLSLLPGHVTRFPFGQPGDPPTADKLKVPHMGWNRLIIGQADHPLVRGIPPGADAYAYFVHSYYVVPDDPAHIVATTDYGFKFASICARDNVMGIQPHPEKSQSVGLRILKNFIDL